jgi:membrane protein DedA with SNARE-associated domain
MIPYITVAIFAIIEGEIYYSAVCGQALRGHLSWIGVLCAGAIGGATGDQIWFYLLRRRIHWIDRFPKLRKYHDSVVARVHSHETMMLLVSRFLPGLRTAIPIACAYANVQPLKFSALNLVSAFAWASAIMLFVKTGTATLSAFGLSAWWGPLLPALLVVLFFRWLGRPPRSRT